MEKNIQNTKIAVIILSYNGSKYFPDLFNSLREQTLKPSEVVIVDNNSADDSVEYIRKIFSEATLIASKKNTGFAGGNNIGIKEALKNKLPPAGNIAKKINGKFKIVRERLNLEASHFSFNPRACNHLTNWKNGSLRYYQKCNETVLKVNLWLVFSIILMLESYAVRCLRFKELLDIKLGKEIEEWAESGLKLEQEKML